MIPLGDVIPSRTAPVLTMALVAANALTFTYLHPVGVAANMAALWLFGGTVEDRMGHGRFFAFYLLCGALGGLAPAAAVGGVVAAYVTLYPRALIVTLVPVPFFVRVIELPALTFAAIWLVLEAAAGTPLARLVAGIGAGVAGVRVFRRRERMRVEWWNERPRRR